MSQFIKILLVMLSPVFIEIILVLFFIMMEIKKGKKIKKSESTYKRKSVLYRLFYEFPKRLAHDIVNRNPDEFKEYGLHMFCGEQGSGKTISVVEMLLRMKEIYPQVKIRTNMSYLYQDASIKDWKDLIKNENGEYGQIEVLDEIQTWFSSMESKNFPPEMLTEISQQRKQRKMLIGTAQVFSRIAKPIREQTTFVYCPLTVLGCLTIVRKTKPKYWDDEKQVFKRYIKTYFFVHTDKIRNAFDTYKKIERYSVKGFKIPEWRKAE
jgi:hypothetical protein